MLTEQSTSGARRARNGRRRHVTRAPTILAAAAAAAAAATTAVVLLTAASAAPLKQFPLCPTGLTCGTLAPKDEPGLVFTCARAGPAPGAASAGNVYLMHGNAEIIEVAATSKGMWAETQLQLAAKGYNTLACDQRGFSPGAAPDDMAAYNYDFLAQDILSVTDAAGWGSQFGGKFHIVSHDQGARVAWHSIAKGLTRDRLISFASLSIPHADVFSSNVCCGAGTHLDDQTAQQYVWQLSLPDSDTVDDERLFKLFGAVLRMNTTLACQKPFWWYNGGIDSGAMALAPLLTPFHGSAAYINISGATVKALSKYPTATGVPQTVKVGVVREFPVFYACGARDPSDLCTPRHVAQTKAMITSAFTSAINACAHQLLSPTCPSSERQKVIDGIIANIESATRAARAAAAA